jgi:hypothetical protein
LIGRAQYGGARLLKTADQCSGGEPKAREPHNTMTQMKARKPNAKSSIAGPWNSSSISPSSISPLPVLLNRKASLLFYHFVDPHLKGQMRARR